MNHKIKTRNIFLKFLISHLSFFNSGRGQALITLLFFTVIAINITAVAVVIIIINSLSGTKFQQGSIAYQVAETGIENAKLRLLRDPDYTGEILPVGLGTATITVTRDNTQYMILSKGTVGNFVRQIQAGASYSASLLVITSQQEVY